MIEQQRTDDELDAILHDTCEWAINGLDGSPRGFAASLRLAIDRAREFTSVSSITRRPFNNVVVMPDQIVRLRKRIAGREVPIIKFTEPWKHLAAT